MLKGFVSGAEKDITRIPMKTAQLVQFPYSSGSLELDGITWTMYADGKLTGEGTTTKGTNYYITNRKSLPLKAGTYTLSWQGNKTMNLILRNQTKSETITNIGGTSTSVTFTITDDIPETDLISLYFNASVSGTTVSVDGYPMLNTGSQPLPYEPYGYQEGWEVRDNQDRLIWGREDELQTTTGTIPFKGYGLPVKVKSLLGNGQQTGTPTPDNPVMPTFCGVRTGNLFDKTATNTDNGYIPNGYVRADGAENTNRDYRASEYIAVNASAAYTLYCAVSLNAPSVCFYDSDKNYINGESYSGRVTIPFTTPQDTSFLRLSYRAIDEDVIMLNLGSTALPYEPYGWQIPLTCAGQTTPVYLGQTQTMRKIKKYVFTGRETWSFNNATGVLYTFSITDFLATNGITCMCSHYSAQNNVLGVAEVQNKHVCFRTSTYNQFYLKDTDLNSTDAIKSYLAEQYAAGTPVTVWYVLATPETAIVNEPLYKIGDYADELNDTVATLPEIPTTTGQNTLTVDTTLAPSNLTVKGHIKTLT